MIDVPEITPSQKTLKSPYKNDVLRIMSTKNPEEKISTEKEARDEVAAGLRNMRKSISNSIFVEQRRKQHEAEKNSIIDPLTGLDNRRSVFGDESKPNPSAELKRIFLEAKREGKPLSVIMMDIDHFKKVNDVFSHDSGDSVLKQIAQLFKKTIRETDIVARYGGEEFIFILENTNLSGAIELAEKIREAVAQNNFNKENKSNMPNQITVSAGVSTFSKESKKIVESEKDLFLASDEALKFAKENGRNGVWVAEEKTLANGEVINHIHSSSIETKKPFNPLRLLKEFIKKTSLEK